MILLLIKTFKLMLFGFKYCELCGVLCIYWFNSLGRPPDTLASASANRRCEICIGNVFCLPGRRALLHCFTAILTPTHQNGGTPHWTLGSAMLPPIGTASALIPLSTKLKQAHQRGLRGGSMEMWRGRGEQKWVRGGKKRKTFFMQSPNVTEPNPNQYLWVVQCCYNASLEHISRRWKHQSG